MSCHGIDGTEERGMVISMSGANGYVARTWEVAGFAVLFP
jgi:hypothetical protein